MRCDLEDTWAGCLKKWLGVSYFFFSHPVAVLRDRFGDARESVQNMLPYRGAT
jgi:hypothetical protein